VGREAGSKSIYSANKEIYEKWSQGLDSAHDLITASYWEGASEGPGNIAYVAVLPIVVVPDGRLWTVQYDSDGVRTGEPVKTERCSYFVNTAYRMSSDGPDSESVTCGVCHPHRARSLCVRCARRFVDDGIDFSERTD
jgi:hypothetical protein